MFHRQMGMRSLDGKYGEHGQKNGTVPRWWSTSHPLQLRSNREPERPNIVVVFMVAVDGEYWLESICRAGSVHLDCMWNVLKSSLFNGFHCRRFSAEILFQGCLGSMHVGSSYYTLL